MPIKFAKATTLTSDNSDSAFSNGTNSLLLADFNRDGKLDIVTSGSTSGETTGKLFTFLGNGTSKFASPVITSGQPLGSIVNSDDFNQDGNLDLIRVGNTGVQSSNVLVSFGNGKGEFTSGSSLTVNSAIESLAIGDVNGDGQLDAVTANGSGQQTVSLLLGDGTGNLKRDRDLAVEGQPKAIALKDLDGDGRLDIAVVTTEQGSVTRSRLTVFKGNGQDSFVPTASIVLSESASNPDIDNLAAITTGDFNQDGRTDIAASAAGKIAILKNDSNQSLKLVYQLEQTAPSLAVGDFNGDGRVDLATVGIGYNTYRPNYYLGSGTTILLGDGSGSFSRAVPYADDIISSLSLAVADLDQDQKPDLAFSPQGSGLLYVLMNRTTDKDAIAEGVTSRLTGKKRTFVDASSELRAGVTIDLATRKLILNTAKPLKLSLQKNNEAIGTRLNDILKSRDRGSFLNGWGGNDQLIGRKGDDRLVGGAGKDELTGNSGNDRFIFSATSNYPEGLEIKFKKSLLGVDRILDFESGKDKIILDAGTFTQLSEGKKVSFRTVDDLSEAKASRGIITYVRDNSRLYYNENGSAAGFGNGGIFAILEDAPKLGSKDFSVFL